MPYEERFWTDVEKLEINLKKHPPQIILYPPPRRVKDQVTGNINLQGIRRVWMDVREQTITFYFTERMNYLLVRGDFECIPKSVIERMKE